MPDDDLLKKMLTSPAMAEFVDSYNAATSVVLSLLTLAVMLLIVVNLVRLAKSADNPQERHDVILSLAVCLVCFSVLGGIDVVYAFLLSILSPIP